MSLTSSERRATANTNPRLHVARGLRRGGPADSPGRMGIPPECLILTEVEDLRKCIRRRSIVGLLLRGPRRACPDFVDTQSSRPPFPREHGREILVVAGRRHPMRELQSLRFPRSSVADGLIQNVPIVRRERQQPNRREVWRRAGVR
jgi:hypothetical protein